MIDLILILALGVAFYGGFRLGAEFNTFKALKEILLSKLK